MSENIFSKSEVLKTLDNDEELLKEIALTFIEDYPKKIAHLKQAIDNKDAQSIHKIAHSLKGSISNFGKKQAFDTANKINLRGKASDIDNIENDFERLEMAIKALDQALRKDVLEQ